MLYACMAVSPLKVRLIGLFLRVIVGILHCDCSFSVPLSIANEDDKREKSTPAGFGYSKTRQKKLLLFFCILFQPYQMSRVFFRNCFLV